MNNLRGISYQSSLDSRLNMSFLLTSLIREGLKLYNVSVESKVTLG